MDANYWKFFRRTCAMLAAGLAGAADTGIVAADDATPAAIFATIREQFVRMESLDVSAQCGRVITEAAPDPAWTVDSLRGQALAPESFNYSRSQYRMEGERFRGSRDGTYADGLDYAYDGAYYQLLVRRSRLLQLNRGASLFAMFAYPGDHEHPAVLRPYDFVFHATSEPASFDKLRLESTWTALAAAAESRGEAVVDGQRCQVVEIVLRNHPRYGIDRTRVFFAVDLGYFPLRYEHYIGDDLFQIFQARQVVEAGSCRRQECTKPHFFAARSVMENFDSMGSGRRTGTQLFEVDVDFLRLNSDIPDEFFTIARSEALAVHDETADARPGAGALQD